MNKKKCNIRAGFVPIMISSPTNELFSFSQNSPKVHVIKGNPWKKPKSGIIYNIKLSD